MKLFLVVLAVLVGSAISQGQCGAACQATKGICVDDGQGSLYCSCSQGYSNAPGDRTTCVASSTLLTSGCRFVGCGANADCKHNPATGKYECACHMGYQKKPNSISECIRKASMPTFTGCRYTGCGNPSLGQCVVAPGGNHQCQCYSNAQFDYYSQKCVEKPFDLFSDNSFLPYMFMGDMLW